MRRPCSRPFKPGAEHSSGADQDERQASAAGVEATGRDRRELGPHAAGASAVLTLTAVP